MEKQKKGKCIMQSSGVTLIALIITIIILLILAMTGVALIMRWNIIEKTEMAAEGYQGASERDAIGLAYDEYALDSMDNKDANLTMEEADVTGNKNGGWNVQFKKSGNKYTVDEDGIIRRTSTGLLEDAVDTDSYGKQVDFKSEGEDLGDLIWRIFYKDRKNVYLISEKPNKEYPVSSLKLSEHTSEYTNGMDVSEQGQDLMPLAKQNGEVFNEENTYDNIKEVAYMCDTTKWEDYLDKEGKAAWAIGGPTIELFAKSYNAAQSDHVIICQIDNKGYTHNTTDGWFTTTLNNGIYRLKENSGDWWLASPSNFSNGICVRDVVDAKRTLRLPQY